MDKSSTTCSWAVRVTSGDASGLYRLMREANEEWWNQMRDSAFLIHDDDPDSDQQFTIRVTSLRNLVAVLNVVHDSKCVSGVVVESRVVNPMGVESWTSIGKDWIDREDSTQCTMKLDEAKRDDVQKQAITEAIRVLKSALGPHH